MSVFNSVIVDESKNIVENLDNEQVMDISNDISESEVTDKLTINNDQTVDINDQIIDSVTKFTNNINETSNQVNNIIVVKAISLPDSPKEIDEVFKGYNDIQKKNNEVINSVGNEVTKKIEELVKTEEINNLEISCSKKKNRWLWWWPW